MDWIDMSSGREEEEEEDEQEETRESLEPDLYKGWLRHVQENCLLYEHALENHQCWEQAREIWPMQNPLTGRTLYGCLRCMRSHMCLPSKKTCPRLVSPQNPGETICPFSGDVITSGASVANSSFNKRNDTFDAMRDYSNLEEGEGPRERSYNVRSGARYAKSLRVRANSAVYESSRRSMRQQADEAERRGKALRLIRTFEYYRGDSEKGTRPPAPKRRRKTVQENGGGAGPDSDLDFVDAVTSGYAEAGDDNPFAPTWVPPCTIVPRTEAEADLAYLRRYLDPLAKIVDTDAFGALFSQSQSQSRTPAVVVKKEAKEKEKEKEQERVPAYLASPAGKDEPFETPWLGLAPGLAPALLRPHQRELGVYIQKFLAHYGPRAPSTAPEPDSVERYAIFCDRVLWLYHRFVAPHAFNPMAWERGYVRGSGTLWPDGEQNRAIFYVLLTRVLTVEACGRDMVTDAKVFVWLPDPFLRTCREAGLFDALPPVESGLLAKSEKGRGFDGMYQNVMAILRGTSFSPHALYTYLHPSYYNSW
jgi:hypothetical protein